MRSAASRSGAEQRAFGGDAVDQPAVALQRVAAADLLEPADEHGVGRLEEQHAAAGSRGRRGP